MNPAYATDLAHIHDVGYGAFAENAGPALLDHLRRAGKTQGLAVDLGCGSGIWATQLVAAGYQVLGIDLSAAMIDIARRRVPRVPEAEFRVGSFLDAELPPCAVVTALGEIFSYLLDPANTLTTLKRLLGRIHDALEPGGVLIFDILTPGRLPHDTPTQRWRQADDWAVLVNLTEDRKRQRLTREITSFRKIGELFQRHNEVHRLRLYDAAKLAQMLRKIGFRVRSLRGYGTVRFSHGQAAFFARKI